MGYCNLLKFLKLERSVCYVTQEEKKRHAFQYILILCAFRNDIRQGSQNDWNVAEVRFLLVTYR